MNLSASATLIACVQMTILSDDSVLGRQLMCSEMSSRIEMTKGLMIHRAERINIFKNSKIFRILYPDFHKD